MENKYKYTDKYKCKISLLGKSTKSLAVWESFKFLEFQELQLLFICFLPSCYQSFIAIPNVAQFQCIMIICSQVPQEVGPEPWLDDMRMV